MYRKKNIWKDIICLLLKVPRHVTHTDSPPMSNKELVNNFFNLKIQHLEVTVLFEEGKFTKQEIITIVSSISHQIQTFMTSRAISGVISTHFWKHSRACCLFPARRKASPFALFSCLVLHLTRIGNTFNSSFNSPYFKQISSYLQLPPLNPVWPPKQTFPS